MLDKDILRRIPLLSQIRDEALEELISEAPGRVRSYSTGDIIALQGSRVKGLMLLLEGAIRAQMTSPEGKRLTIDEIVAPDVLAPAFVYSTDSTLPVSIEATSPTTIWTIDREYLLSYMGRHTMVMRSLLRLISDRSHFLSQRLQSLTLHSLRDRLIAYLKQNGSIGRQEDLALMLGVARPSLARLLSELVEEGVLIRTERSYRLRRPL